MKIYNILKINLRKLAIILAIWIICVVLHNVINSLFHVEEPVFFVLAVFVIPVYTIISVIYTLFFRKVKGDKK